jgi:malonate-semialdehyde dehydrogenase (acetylating)/methylmalonate-semialdehyde dehydrogenase
MPDANIDRTVPNLITSFFGNAGQRCLAGGVLLTVGDVHNPLKEKLIESTKQIKVGDGMDEDNHMGPLASEAGMKKVLEYIQKGIDEGATLVLDGRNVRDDESLKNGFYVGPTIFENVSPEMSIAQEEIFGPVMPIVNVKNLDEAIEVIHNNPYGNASSIFTSSGKSARDYQYLVKAGNIGINIGVAAPIATFPFSGMKDSFMGDLHGQGKSGIDFFTEDKVVITRWFD